MHPCFDDDGSDVEYDTVGALEAHFNNVRVYCFLSNIYEYRPVGARTPKTRQIASASRRR